MVVPFYTSLAMQETFCHSASLSTLGFSCFFICESAFHSNRCIVASCVCVCTQSLSCVYFATTRTVAHQAPMSMGLFRQEYWSGLPFISPINYHGVSHIAVSFQEMPFTEKEEREWVDALET